MKHKLIILAVALVVLTIGTFSFSLLSNDTPEKEVESAGTFLSKARSENCDVYAKGAFHFAQQYYDSALIAWNIENTKPIFSRNHKKVYEFAQKSIRFSKESLTIAKKHFQKSKVSLGARIKRTGNEIDYFKYSFGKFPMNAKHRNAFMECKLLYSESLHAYERKNFNVCAMKLDEVEGILNTISPHYQKKLDKYFEEYPSWKKLENQAILQSKKNRNYAIVIDKFDRTLLLFKNGRLQERFTVELGENWIGDKQQQGDKSTPEGVYKIIEKKQGANTKYYKALLLNYPNEDDKSRFTENIKNGSIKENAKIGNSIEIHGHGGIGADWTNGCIALKNTDIDKVFQKCSVGTTVTIVGSTRSLTEISKIYNE